ncbi:hypothetical protein [Aminobacter sp. Piv2-1]|uniref:hypothetical protein n=1 Tax=Aminobacter sp. Piv2-1 TaxID=3031122 RepID=UPI0030A8D443
MSTVSSFLQLVALSACLTAYACSAGAFPIPGVRRAMQTMAGAGQVVAMESLGQSFSV